MEKAQLLKDLKDSNQDSYSVFKKGYLHKFPMDEEIFQALFPKLISEANVLGHKLAQYTQDPFVFNEQELNLLTTQVENLEKVVFNTCFSQVQKQPYISQSIGILQKKINTKFLEQFKTKQSEGFEVIEDDVGNLKIINAVGQLVYTSVNTPIKEILGDWGVDTSHEQFYLFYFTLIPVEDLESYRKLYLFSNFFKFV